MQGERLKITRVIRFSVFDGKLLKMLFRDTIIALLSFLLEDDSKSIIEFNSSGSNNSIKLLVFILCLFNHIISNNCNSMIPYN